jgi:beta-glucosidase-like glycosyl hydrolase
MMWHHARRSESLHGVARDGMATSFPQIGLVACSMNRTLWHAMGDTTSTEGRGKNNPLHGGLYQGLTFWAPVSDNLSESRAYKRAPVQSSRTWPHWACSR